MSDSAEERTIHWYFSTNGKQNGPVLLTRLCQMARQGLLKPNDLVRKGLTGEWAYAGNVEELASHAEEFALATSTESEAEDDSEPTPEPARHGPSLMEQMSDFISALMQGMASRLELARTLAGYLAFVVMLFFLGRVLISAGFFDWSTPDDPYVVIQSLWDELQANRLGRVDDTTWRDFAERGQQELKPVIAGLQLEAGSTNREAQLLLWASRDCLSKMLTDARESPSRSEQQLAEYLGNVDLLRKGRPIFGGNAGGRRPRLAQLPSPRRWFVNDPWTETLTVLLTATNLTLLGWFVMGLIRSRASAQ